MGLLKKMAVKVEHFRNKIFASTLGIINNC